MTEITTTDVYLAAYLLQLKHPCKEILCEGQRRTVMFTFPKTATPHVAEFRENRAKVPIREYLAKLEEVRDRMQAKLRGARP